MKRVGVGWCRMNNKAAPIKPLLASLTSSLVSACKERNETTSEDCAGLFSILCSGDSDKLIPAS